MVDEREDFIALFPDMPMRAMLSFARCLHKRRLTEAKEMPLDEALAEFRETKKDKMNEHHENAFKLNKLVGLHHPKNPFDMMELKQIRFIQARALTQVGRKRKLNEVER